MTRKHLLWVGLAMLLLMVGLRAQHLNALAGAPPSDILIAYDPATASSPHCARTEWEAVLQRERIAHQWVPLRDFSLLDGSSLAHRFAAIVLPQRLSADVPDAVRAQLAGFVAAGGSLVTSGDPTSLRGLALRIRTSPPVRYAVH